MTMVRDEPRVGALVLAAGRGTRFGGGKLLARLGGRPILQHVLEQLHGCSLSPIVVVEGPDGQQFDDAIRWREEQRVVNPTPERGLSSSVQIGLGAVAALPAPPDAVLIALGDQPLIDRDVVHALIAALSDDPDARPIVVPRYADDSASNPVLIGRSAWPIAAEASGDRGLGPILRAHPTLVRSVDVPGSNPDIDTPADLEHVRSRIEGEMQR